MPRRALLAILLLCLAAALGSHAAQSGDQTLAEVRQQARKDAQANKPQRPGSELQVLFGQEANAAGVSMRQVVSTYEDEYARAKPVKPWWEELLPNAGWLTAILLLLVVVFKESLQKALGGLIEAVQKRIYNRFAGHRLFRRKALRSYRQTLRDKYQEILLPFRPGRPLRMQEVYVPLQVRGTSGAELIQAQAALAQYPRLMVVGPPGSGKSMLIKNLALSYAEGRMVDLPPQSIPILLELNRLNEGDRPLRDHLVEILDLNGFPHGERFIDRGLEEGTLVLLFDGLDEVNSARREAVVGKIKDLLEKHKGCRGVITCRSAVYRDEFFQAVDQTLEIAEFQDQQIRNFLSSWKSSMPEGKSIEQLLQALRDRPQILALARNPLMLTIIAFLYTDTPFILPHSRAEFYDQAIDVLLLQKQGTYNVFKAPQKKLVLQHLALFNQSIGSQDRQDRRSIDLPTILREVKRVLPELNFRDEDAQPILDEIVERSGLLLAIDGGERYQFAHLTLQEFFTAKALASKPDELFARFQNDRDAWRETVKLWCGLAHDCTALVRRIFASDPITAFECLADAQQMSPELADEIVDYFKKRLHDIGDDADPVLRAFGAVASDLRPRGQAIFEFLAGELGAKNSPIPIAALATALSFTNLRRAAEMLAVLYTTKPEARAALTRMGDLAVPILRPLAQQGGLNVLEDLQRIGTPQAAAALASMLWDDSPRSMQAAILLSSFLGRDDAEEALRRFQLSEEQRHQEIFPWAWAPFQEPEESSLPIIAGRISFLIDKLMAGLSENPHHSDFPQIAPQIILPLVVQASTQSNLELSPAIHARLRLLNLGELRILEPGKREQFIQEILPTEKPGVCRLIYLLNCLDHSRRWDIFQRLVNEPAPNLEDWKHIFRPIRYKFYSSNYYRAALILSAFVSLLALVEIVSELRSTSIGSLAHTLALLACLSIGGCWYLALKPPKLFDEFTSTLEMERLSVIGLGFFLWPLAFIVGVGSIFKDPIYINRWVISVLTFSPIAGFTAALGYFSTLIALPRLGIAGTILSWALVLGIIAFLYLLGYRKERRARRNPLAGALQLSGRSGKEEVGV